MKITIENEAAEWFKKEMNVKDGDAVRFLVRYGGASPIQDGYSLGITPDQPNDIGASDKKENVLYYVEKEDLWYFNDYNLVVDVDQDLEELQFKYEK